MLLLLNKVSVPVGLSNGAHYGTDPPKVLARTVNWRSSLWAFTVFIRFRMGLFRQFKTKVVISWKKSTARLIAKHFINKGSWEMAFESDEKAKAYWRENVSLMLKLLVVWFSVSYGAGIIFADWLNQFQFFGFKLGFWFAQQGAIYVFVLLIFVYVHQMNKLDRKYDVHEG
ncbi:DUF4212 domain-containing protein [Aeromonas salmonicida]|nr:DUF4212 domain-containing protein [Aeromonas salmonicida]